LDNLFLDARAAWGTSSNDIWLADAVAGRRSGSFDTDRWLASANLTGNYNYGPWRLSPQLGIAYGSEAYDTYFNNLGQAVEGSRATIGRLTGGAEVGYRVMLDSGAILEPHVSLTGIWNFDTDDVSIGGVLVQSDETRARVEGGLIYRTPTGFAMRGAVAYDGIGGDDFEAVSGQLWVSVPLN
jgi:outer membrane autotransporter protein